MLSHFQHVLISLIRVRCRWRGRRRQRTRLMSFTELRAFSYNSERLEWL